MDLDKLHAEIDGEVAILFRDLRSEIDRITARLRKENGLITNDAVNLSIINQAMRTMQQRLGGAGFSKFRSNQAKRLSKLSESILKEGGKLGFADEYTGTSKAMIDALLRGMERGTLQLESAIAGDMEQILLRVVTGGLSYGDLVESIRSKLEINARQALTFIDTSIAGFMRSIREAHATDNGVEWFLYDGPQHDMVIRPFCEHFAGTRVTIDILKEHQDEWERDSQPTPVEVYLGGYNCRHDLVPLVDITEIEKYQIGPK